MKSLSKIVKTINLAVSATILSVSMPIIANAHSASQAVTKRLPIPTPEFCQWCADNPIEASDPGFACHVCDF